MAGIDSYTKLLLHCDGNDGYQTFIDSASGKTVTAYGEAQTDTAQYKFGNASCLLDGNGDYLSIADSDDFYFNADFTIDFWIRFSALPSASTADTIYSQGTSGGKRNMIYIYNNGGTYQFVFNVADGGVADVNTIKNSNPNLAINTWYHIACVRSGTTTYIFQGGTSLGTGTASGAYNIAAAVLIGQNGAATEYVNGWIDEFRISKGIARWTANFTPPISAYSRQGGFSGGQPWIFLKDAWEKHDRLWIPKLSEGYSY
jgi:hypothetical protein